MTSSTINLFDRDREGLEAFFSGLGERPFRARQILPWLYRRGVTDFSSMTDLGRALRERLGTEAVVDLPEVVSDRIAADGTRKWLLQLADGNCIESVFIPEGDRGTLCVSSQVGCALNCSFCATARQGYNRNLTTAEIIGQVWVADRLLPPRAGGERALTNVVLMGMGEPLLNFDNVVPALRLMVDDLAYGLSRRRVTVSTAGMVPAIDRLAEACSVSLAVSLHAPDDELRSQLVPLNRKYPIAELLASCKRYVAGEPRRKVTFEYTLLAGVNDSTAQAGALARLLRDIPAKVNLIPFNPFPDSGYERPSQEAIDAFRDVLLKAGLITVTRRTRGEEIDAACGQLAGRVQDRTRRSARMQRVAAPLMS